MPFQTAKFRAVKTNCPIEQGSRVKPIQGGPEMAVSSFSDDKKQACCVWWDEVQLQIRTKWFPIKSLEKV
jgi:uncharacterized protein YodC (DUF2158 family)